MEQIAVTLDSTSSNAATGGIEISAAEVAPRHAPIAGAPPVFMEPGQAYYWTRIWQQGEQESRSELERGLGRRFASGREAIRWLLSDDE